MNRERNDPSGVLPRSRSPPIQRCRVSDLLQWRRMANTVFVVVVLARFLVPLAIPGSRCPPSSPRLVLDAADQSIFQMFTDDPLPGYQTYDKALDVYYLAIAYCSTMRNWRKPVAFRIDPVPLPVPPRRRRAVRTARPALAAPGLPEHVRVLLHRLRVRPYEVGPDSGSRAVDPRDAGRGDLDLHQAAAGVVDPRGANSTSRTSWPTIPFMWAVLGTLVVARRSCWYTQSAGACHGQTGPSPSTWTTTCRRWTPPRRGGSRSGRIVLIEKVVLLVLISVIFAQVLPDVSREQRSGRRRE